LLRRLSVVGLAWVCLCMPAAARAGTVAIFYYPWYATSARDGTWQHWNQNNHRPPSDLYSRFYPAGGPYSSTDPTVIDRQMTQIASAGVDEVVISWWGRGSLEDARLAAVVSNARRHGLLIGVHLEPYGGRTPATVADDAQYLAGYGVRDIYVYEPRDSPAPDWAAARDSIPATMRLLAGTEKVGFAVAGRFDGVYTYDFLTNTGAKFARLCAQAHAKGLVCAPSVGPGYDGRRAGELSVGRTRRNGATYDALWSATLTSHADIVSVTSFNEWGEGTQIEPAEPRRGYRSYEGAWGLTGDAARGAYLARTAFWAAKFHSLR
jgi:glycoprotein endo-alpha-1,2-mannosidase